MNWKITQRKLYIKQDRDTNRKKHGREAKTTKSKGERVCVYYMHVYMCVSFCVYVYICV